MSASDRDEPVGYKRPPRHSRFQKGQSGNPAGRPRKNRIEAVPDSSAADDILRAQYNRKITIRDGGKVQTRTVLEAISLAQQKSALEGNSIAQREALRTARELEERDRLRQEAAAAEEQDRQLESYNGGLLWRDDQQKAWDEAEAEGREPDEPWPHPEDFIINHASKNWRVRGPLSSKDIFIYEHIRAQRDWHFTSCIIWSRRKRGNWRFYVQLHQLWAYYDKMLPLRWQIGGKTDELVEFFFVMTMADLKSLAATYKRRTLMNPLPPLDIKSRRQIDAAVSRAMRPVLKPSNSVDVTR